MSEKLKEALLKRYHDDPVTATILACWVELCEKDDRTSPEGYPDHCLITYDELADYMRQSATVGAKK